MLPRKLQSRYRRHLFNPKLLFQITRARRSLNQLSRFTIHSVQEFHISPIQSRKNVSETNIVVIYNHTPQQRISLIPSPSFLPSFLRLHRSRTRRKRRRRRAHHHLSLLLIILKHILGKRQTPRERENLSRDTPRSREQKHFPRSSFAAFADSARERKGERSARLFVVPLFCFSLLFLCHSRRERRYRNTHARFFRPILPRGNDGARKMETRRTRASRNAKNERCFDEANEET